MSLNIKVFAKIPTFFVHRIEKDAFLS